METTCAALRLRRLQAQLSDGMACLAIGGVDSGWDRGSAQLLGFLLLGRSGRDAVSAPSLPPAYEDAILLVKGGPEAVMAAYLPSQTLLAEVRLALGDMAASCQLFAPTDEEAQDVDLAEECKVAAFVQMLRGVKRVGIPWGVPAEGSAPAAVPDAGPLSNPPLEGVALMALESWPIVQAYGLDGVGRDGFFTQNFAVHDVYDQLQGVYADMDSVAVEQVLQEGVTSLIQHWGEMMKGVSQAPSQDVLSERMAAEPLLNFFNYGMMRAAPGVSKVVTMPPRVVFGLQTNDEGAMPGATTLGEAATAGGLHLIVEGADPHSPLRAARTYFTSTATLTKNLFETQDEAEDGFNYETATAGWDATQTIYLMRVYTALIEAAQAGMKHFAGSSQATVHTTRAAVLEELVARTTALGVLQPALAYQLRFSLWQVDHANRLSGMAQKGKRQVAVLRVALLDIHAAGGGPLLGGLVYADSFLEIPGADDRGRGRLLVLTQAVPQLCAWAQHLCEPVLLARATTSFLAAISGPDPAASATVAAGRAEERARQQQQAMAGEAARAKRLADKTSAHEEGAAEEDLDEEDAHNMVGPSSSLEPGWEGGSLGTLLTLGGGDDVIMLTGCTVMAAVPGNLWCFAQGFVFIVAQTSAMFVLNFREVTGTVESVTVQDLRPPSGSQCDALREVLVLRGQAAACGLAPICHLTTNRNLALPIGGMSPAARRHLLSNVLPAWQRACREGLVGQEEMGEGGSISWVRDESAESPFPPACHAVQVAAVQALQGTKARPGMTAPDAEVDTALAALDQAELVTLCPLDEDVEVFLAGASPSAGSIPITLVVGLPGAEQSKVVCALLAALDEADLRPQAALLRDEPAQAHQQACADTSVKGRTGTTHEDFERALDACSNCRHVVLATMYAMPLVAQLRALASCRMVASGRAHLVGVIGCLASATAFEDPVRSAPMPGLAAQLPPGFLDALVVGGQPRSTAEVTQLFPHLFSATSRTPVIRGGGGVAALLRAKEDLVPAFQERAARLAATQAQRRWAYASPSPCCALRGLSVAVHLTFSGQLSVDKLREELAQLGLETPGKTPGSPHLPLRELSAGDAWLCGAWGVVRTALGAPAQEVVAGRTGGLRTLTDVGSLPSTPWAYGAPHLLSSDVTCGGEVLLWGVGLQPSALQAMLERCSPGTGATPTGGSHACIEGRLNAIKEAHKFDPLPEGYSFDGDRYYDEFGDHMLDHPHLQRFISQAQAEADQALVAAGERATREKAAGVQLTGVQQWPWGFNGPRP